MHGIIKSKSGKPSSIACMLGDKAQIIMYNKESNKENCLELQENVRVNDSGEARSMLTNQSYAIEKLRSIIEVL